MIIFLLLLLFGISNSVYGKILSENDQALTDQLRKDLLTYADENGDEYLKNWLEKTPPGRLHNWIDYTDFDIEKSQTSIIDYMKWRQQTDLDNVENWKYSEKDDMALPFTFNGFDDEGDSICYALMGHWDVRTLLSQGMQSAKIVQQLTRCFEWGLKRKNPKTGKYADNMVGLMDMKDFSLRQVTTIRSISVALQMARVFMARFPLYAKKFIIFNDPSYFSIMYNAVKAVLSAKAFEPVILLGTDESKYRAYFEKNLPKSTIPDYYGGEAKLNFLTHEIEK